MKIFGEAFRARLLPISLTQAAGVACGIAGVKIVSSLVPPEKFAAYGIFLTFTTLGVWIVHAGLIKYLMRAWAAETDRPALLLTVGREWSKRLPWLGLAAAAGTTSIVYFGGTPVLGTFLTLLTSASMLSAIACMQAILQAERSHWSDFVLSATGSVGRSFAAPLCFILCGRTTWALFLGFATYALINAATGLGLLRRYLASSNSREKRSVTLPSVYLGPLFVALALATWVLYGINRWLVAWRFEDVFAGWFTFAGNLGSLVAAVLGGIFIQFFQPSLYALADTGGSTARTLPRRIDVLSASLCASSVAGLLALWWISPALMGVLIAEKYRPALEWILPTGCFAVTIVASQFYHIMLLALKKERSCGAMDLTTAGVLILAATTAVFFGQKVFWWVLVLSPLTTLLVSRTLARAYLNGPDSR